MAKPVVPWMGGKRRLAKYIIPMMPPHQCYVEPFSGGAAILFMKEPSKVEVLNDVDRELVNLYRVIKYHLAEFVQQFRWALVSRTVFEWAKMERPETLTDIQRAARFYYLQKLAFGAKPTGQSFGISAVSPPRLNLLRIEEELSAAHLRLSRVLLESEDWRAVIKRYDRARTLFYLDPPYWQTAGYGTPFEAHEYEDLAQVMRSMKGKGILSINDRPDIREVFSGLKMESISIRYTVGATTGKRPKSAELLIRNFE